MIIFPENNYGRCPLGHNIQPSGTTGNDISTTQIDDGETRLLFWSNYYQRYVCRMHLDRVPDKKNELIFHEKQVEIQKKLQGMGFVNQSS
jgi:hypothetical protein